MGLAGALGCVLATDVAAAEDLPPFANSAMDGFAVRGADLAGAGEDHPVALEVTGEVFAGTGRLPGRAGRGRPHHDRRRPAAGGGGAGRADLGRG